MKIKSILFFSSLFILFFFLLYSFFPKRGPFSQSWDNIPTALFPITILNEHNFDFNEFREGQQKLRNEENSRYPQYYFFVNQNEKVVANYPVLNGILITPFYFIYSFLDPQLLKSQTFYNNHVFNVDYLTSILLTLINAFLIYLICQNTIKNRFLSVLSMFLFVFATPVVSTTSRFVWQHTIAILLISLMIFSFQKKHFFFVLFFSTLAFLCRPPTILLCLPFLFSLGMRALKRKRLNKMNFLNLFLLLLIIFLFYFQTWYAFSYLNNGKYFFAPQYSTNPPYNLGSQYSLSRFNGSVVVGFFGLIFSPGRGLLFFSPIFIFSFIELLNGVLKKKYWEYSLSLLLYILVFAKSEWWYGGWSTSYRYLIETIPILIIFFTVFWQKIIKEKNILIGALISITIILSIFFNALLGTFYEDCGYNSSPSDIDLLSPQEKNLRLFTDSPIFRCLNRLRK